MRGSRQQLLILYVCLNINEDADDDVDERLNEFKSRKKWVKSSTPYTCNEDGRKGKSKTVGTDTTMRRLRDARTRVMKVKKNCLKGANAKPTKKKLKQASRAKRI